MQKSGSSLAVCLRLQRLIEVVCSIDIVFYLGCDDVAGCGHCNVCHVSAKNSVPVGFNTKKDTQNSASMLLSA